MLRPLDAPIALWRRKRLVLPLAVVAGVVAGAAVPVAHSLDHARVAVTGLSQGALLGKAGLSALQVTVTAHGGPAAKLTVELDGHPLTGQRSGNTVVVHPTGLADGRHTLVASLPGRFHLGGATVERTFTVDTTPPTLTLDAPAKVASLRDPVTVKGRVDGATSVIAEGKPVTVTDGTFSIAFAHPPADAPVVAKDAAGNSTTQTVTVPAVHGLVRGVHVTGYAWNYAGLRDPILRLARQHKINTVELDIKEEDGYVNYDTTVKLAHEAGAIRKLYDPAKVVAQLHQMGVQVVGRIVAFRDPVLATWAWRHGHRDWVVQTPGGQPYASTYGSISFTNFSSAQVQQYNIDLATEAAKLGFDDIMYDYVRRPDGPIGGMKFVGITGTPEQEVAKFVRDTRGPVRAAGAYLGAAVFGVSATRPKEVAQDIPMLAKYVDYVSPMVYPSHWAPGEYKVANPNAQPYDIVVRSLKDFQKQVRGSSAQVVPWLQDFSLGVTYDTPQVVAQVRAAADDGVHGFFLWDAGCVYHAAALPRLR